MARRLLAPKRQVNIRLFETSAEKLDKTAEDKGYTSLSAYLTAKAEREAKRA